MIQRDPLLNRSPTERFACTRRTMILSAAARACGCLLLTTHIHAHTVASKQPGMTAVATR